MNQIIQPASLPMLLRVLMWAAAFYSLWLMIWLILAISSDAVSIGSNTALDSALWLPLLGPLYAIKSALMAAIAFGFYKQKRWARHLIQFFWIAVVMYVLIVFGPKEFLHRQMKWEIIQAGTLGGITVWYFYFKDGVVKYYKALAKF